MAAHPMRSSSRQEAGIQLSGKMALIILTSKQKTNVLVIWFPASCRDDEQKRNADKRYV